MLQTKYFGYNNTYIDTTLDELASLNAYPPRRANCKATCMHSHKYNTSMLTDWYNASGRSQIKYLGHVPNECKHLFDANLYRDRMPLGWF